MAAVADGVVIKDVGPRDGLQNQPKILAPRDRVRLIRALLDAGVKYVEDMSMLFEHFPASVVYLDRQPGTLTLSAWLREDH